MLWVQLGLLNEFPAQGNIYTSMFECDLSAISSLLVQIIQSRYSYFRDISSCRGRDSMLYILNIIHMEKPTTPRRRVTPHMIFAAILLCYSIGAYFGCIFPNFHEGSSLAILTTLYCLATLMMIVSLVGTMYINPFRINPLSEEQPRRKKSEKQMLAFCRICKISLGETTKHCRNCDRCTDGFDHHCKWIDKCIGSKNYVWFLWLIGSSFAHLCVFIISGIVMVARVEDRQKIIAQIVVVSIGMIVFAVMTSLNLYLIIHQMYVYFKEKQRRLLTRSAQQGNIQAKIFPVLNRTDPIQQTKSPQNEGATIKYFSSASRPNKIASPQEFKQESTNQLKLDQSTDINNYLKINPRRQNRTPSSVTGAAKSEEQNIIDQHQFPMDK